MAGFIGVGNANLVNQARFANIGWSSTFPYNGTFRPNNSLGGFGGVGNFGGLGGFGSFGGAGLYGFGGNIGGFGGAGAWGALAASIGFLVGSMIQNIITNRQDGGGHEGCGECQLAHNENHSGHPDMQAGHTNYIDGPSQHRWDGDGYNMSFDVDYA